MLGLGWLAGWLVGWFGLVGSFGWVVWLVRLVGWLVGWFLVSRNICHAENLLIQTVPFLCQVMQFKPSLQFQLLLN